MDHSSHLTIHTQKTSVLDYWPIAAIYVLSVLLSLISIQFNPFPDLMSHVMGFVLVLFGLIKLNDILGFAEGFRKYDPLARVSSSYALFYPFLEIGLGILFIAQALVLPSTLLTLVIYSVSLYGAIQSLRSKEKLHCVCLGTYFKLPLSNVTILESVFMILMCAWMLLMINTMAGMPM